MSSGEETNDQLMEIKRKLNNRLIGRQVNERSGGILPLNSAVIQRIRLNMGSNRRSNVTTDADNGMACMKTEAADVVCPPQSVATVLQNSMKQKLADVLQQDSDSQLTESAVIDVAVLWRKWSTLDTDYQKLTQTMTRNSRKRNTISLDSDLWSKFDEKMIEMRQLLNGLNQNKSSDAKRSSPQQTLITNKRLKHCL